MHENFVIRTAGEKDTGLILTFIKKLAKYERMSDQVTANEEILNDNLFNKNYAEVLIAEENGVPVGFALYFHNFSTFLGKPGVYLEDLFVEEEHRGKGYGKALLKKLAGITIERGCGRLEWAVLDWNTPSINFYKALGAEVMDEWHTFRLTGDSLKELSN